MSGALEGRVALVTGAGAGIGAGVARRLADEGARLVIAELDDEAGRAVAAEVDGVFFRTDVGEREQDEKCRCDNVSECDAIEAVTTPGAARDRSGRQDRPAARRRHRLAIRLWAMRAAFPT